MKSKIAKAASSRFSAAHNWQLRRAAAVHLYHGRVCPFNATRYTHLRQRMCKRHPFSIQTHQQRDAHASLICMNMRVYCATIVLPACSHRGVVYRTLAAPSHPLMLLPRRPLQSAPLCARSCCTQSTHFQREMQFCAPKEFRLCCACAPTTSKAAMASYVFCCCEIISLKSLQRCRKTVEMLHVSAGI